MKIVLLNGLDFFQVLLMLLKVVLIPSQRDYIDWFFSFFIIFIFSISCFLPVYLLVFPLCTFTIQIFSQVFNVVFLILYKDLRYFIRFCLYSHYYHSQKTSLTILRPSNSWKELFLYAFPTLFLKLQSSSFSKSLILNTR